jgi:hypothetical protein
MTTFHWMCAWMGHQFERGFCSVCGKRVGR